MTAIAEPDLALDVDLEATIPCDYTDDYSGEECTQVATWRYIWDAGCEHTGRSCFSCDEHYLQDGTDPKSFLPNWWVCVICGAHSTLINIIHL